MFLDTWQESRHIHKCDDGNVEGITETNKTSSFNRWIYVQTAWKHKEMTK